MPSNSLSRRLAEIVRSDSLRGQNGRMVQEASTFPSCTKDPSCSEPPHEGYRAPILRAAAAGPGVKHGGASGGCGAESENGSRGKERQKKRRKVKILPHWGPARRFAEYYPQFGPRNSYGSVGKAFDANSKPGSLYYDELKEVTKEQLNSAYFQVYKKAEVKFSGDVGEAAGCGAGDRGAESENGSKGKERQEEAKVVPDPKYGRARNFAEKHPEFGPKNKYGGVGPAFDVISKIGGQFYEELKGITRVQFIGAYHKVVEATIRAARQRSKVADALSAGPNATLAQQDDLARHARKQARNYADELYKSERQEEAQVAPDPKYSSPARVFAEEHPEFMRGNKYGGVGRAFDVISKLSPYAKELKDVTRAQFIDAYGKIVRPRRVKIARREVEAGSTDRIHLALLESERQRELDAARRCHAIRVEAWKKRKAIHDRILEEIGDCVGDAASAFENPPELDAQLCKGRLRPLVHASKVNPRDLQSFQHRGRSYGPGEALWPSNRDGKGRDGKDRRPGYVPSVWGTMGGYGLSDEAIELDCSGVELRTTAARVAVLGDPELRSPAVAALTHMLTHHKHDVLDPDADPLYLYIFLPERDSPYPHFCAHQLSGGMRRNEAFYVKHTGAVPVGPNVPGLVVLKVVCGHFPIVTRVVAVDPTLSTWVNNVKGAAAGGEASAAVAAAVASSSAAAGGEASTIAERSLIPKRQSKLGDYFGKRKPPCEPSCEPPCKKPRKEVIDLT